MLALHWKLDGYSSDKLELPGSNSCSVCWKKLEPSHYWQLCVIHSHVHVSIIQHTGWVIEPNFMTSNGSSHSNLVLWWFLHSRCLCGAFTFSTRGALHRIHSGRSIHVPLLPGLWPSHLLSQDTSNIQIIHPPTWISNFSTAYFFSIQ